MLGKEGGGKVAQVRQQRVLLIRPIGSELKGVSIRLVLTRSAVCLFLLGIAGSVRVVFRFRSVADNEYLYIVEHSLACPEGIPQITVYLVESLLDSHPSALQFDMHQGQTIDQYRYVVAILMCTILHLILIDDLQTIVIDIRLVNELDVLCQSIVQCQVQHVAFALYHLRLIDNGHLLIRNHR